MADVARTLFLVKAPSSVRTLRAADDSRAPRATRPRKPPYTVGFYLVPDFPMMAFAAAIEPLRAANRLAGERLYDWRLYTRDGSPARPSNGLALAVNGSIRDAAVPDVLLVCAGTRDAARGEKDVLQWLRHLARNGAAIGGISLGAYALAYAGLLDGRRCTLHWENLAAFAEQFPRIRTTTDIFVIDGDRCTCSGGTAALDMMLELITVRDGRSLANDVSEQFIHPRIRGARDQQRMAIRSRLGVASEKLVAAIDLMEKSTEEAREVADIAARVSLSTRQLERLFAKYLHKSPSRYYLELRLDCARALLLETAKPILDIAVACGFASASHFGRCYRMVYGHRPSAERAATPPPRRRHRRGPAAAG